MSYRIERLGLQDRKSFKSNSEPLDRYFREQASQDVRKGISSCLVALTEHDAVAGFYTLAAAAVRLDQLPSDWTCKLPRYPVVPAALLGRLAVDEQHRGRGLGALLVADAFSRAARSDLAAFALVVDAKDSDAEAFYRHLGFEPLDGPLRLVLPVATFQKT